VLVVDDDPRRRRHPLRLLEFGASGHSAPTSGREALQIAPASAPDVIVMDVMMPEMDGLTVCAELAKDERTAASADPAHGKDDHPDPRGRHEARRQRVLDQAGEQNELYTRVQAQIRARQALRAARSHLDTLSSP